MISKILFEGKILNNKDNYAFDEQYVSYLILKSVYRNPGIRDAAIISELAEYLPSDLIKSSQVIKFLNDNCVREKTNWYLNASQSSTMNRVEAFEKTYSEFKRKTQMELFLEVSETFKKETTIDEKLPCVAALNNSFYDNWDNYYVAKANYVFSNYELLIEKTTTVLKSINSFFDELPITILIGDDAIIGAFSLNNIATIGDLKQLDSEIALAICFIHIDEFIQTAIAIGEDYNNFFRSFYEVYYSGLSEKQIDVFRRRVVYGKHPETLEEIAADYDVTRERIRQIEAKARKKVLLNTATIEKIINCLFAKLSKEGKSYLCMSDLIRHLQEEMEMDDNQIEEAVRLIVFFVENSSLKIKFDKETDILFDSESEALDDLKKNFIKNNGTIIRESSVKEFDEFEKNVFLIEYKKLNDELYIIKGASKQALFSEFVAEYFPKGIRVGSDEDYEKAASLFSEKYGDSEEFPDKRALRAMLVREGYTLCARGTVIPSEYAPIIPKKLMDGIFNYIIENEPMVFYSGIYEQYKHELKKIGIDNHYFLKGCLDKHLPEEFNSKRDYILVGEVKTTPSETIIEYMHSQKGEFGLQELRDKFPGVQDYTFYNYISSEDERGVIWTSGRTLVYYENLGIEEDALEELRRFVEKQFEVLNSDVISSRKVYGRLSLTNKHLLKKLNIHGHFAMFSLMRYVFKDYYYSRPLVSRKPFEVRGGYSVIKQYVEGFERFNHRTVTEYTNRMNIGGIYSYLGFMEDMSDKYVQVDIGSMVKKEILGITKSQLDLIRNTLDLLLSRFEYIETENFKAYQMLPTLSVKWNKYLLAGIVRSYFEGLFEIENTTNMYSTTEFKIRRV